jgi:hypothetical protein
MLTIMCSGAPGVLVLAATIQTRVMAPYELQYYNNALTM